MKPAKAFTLIELLVVLAIVVILIAILMPAIVKAKNEARCLTCMATQRQLIILQSCYKADNRGLYCPQNLPGPGMLTADSGSGTDRSSGWVNYITGYTGEKKRKFFWWNDTYPSGNRWIAKYDGAWFCPTQAAMRTGNGNYLFSGVDHFNSTTYDLNPSLFGNRVSFDPAFHTTTTASTYWDDAFVDPDKWAGPSGNDCRFTLRTSSAGQDSRVIAIYDPTAVTQLDQWSWNTPLGANSADSTDPMTLLSFRAHDGIANICMADGHVMATRKILAGRWGPPKSYKEFSIY